MKPDDDYALEPLAAWPIPFRIMDLFRSVWTVKRKGEWLGTPILREQAIMCTFGFLAMVFFTPALTLSTAAILVFAHHRWGTVFPMWAGPWLDRLMAMAAGLACCLVSMWMTLNAMGDTVGLALNLHLWGMFLADFGPIPGFLGGAFLARLLTARNYEGEGVPWVSS